MEISLNCRKKLMKKVKKSQHILSKDSVQCQDEPSKFIAICNSGLANGIEIESVLEKVSVYANVADIVMIPNKSYCFLIFSSPEETENLFRNGNGTIPLGQNGTCLLLSYVKEIPECTENQNHWSTEKKPDGLILIEDFIDDNLEAKLLDAIKWDSDDQQLKHRQVKHFGYEFLYGVNTVDPNKPLEQEIPDECNVLWDILKQKCPEFSWFVPDQMTVNKYLPGQGIPPHCDTHSPFKGPIISLSVGSDIVMEFKRNGTIRNVLLKRKSLLVMSGESRYGWLHGITPRRIDIIPLNGNLTTKKREVRYSYTFRKLNIPPACDCIYPELCDMKATTGNNPNDEYDTKVDDKIARKLENDNVHKVYESIGNHFSETRHSPWPNVEEFIMSLPDYSVLLDVGCGNGKYLNINEKILKIGCDRSETLLKVCQDRNCNIFQCDCLCLPLRDESVDACISIAVIHHLANKTRRLTALREMARVLRKSGRALIYVWAKNQMKNNEKSSYLRQSESNPVKVKNIENCNVEVAIDNQHKIQLPIHTNRTEFQHQNLFVPWKLKHPQQKEKEQCFLRYYHVYEELELEKDCAEIDDIKVVKSYYDQGNWCVIFEKC